MRRWWNSYRSVSVSKSIIPESSLIFTLDNGSRWYCRQKSSYLAAKSHGISEVVFERGSTRMMNHEELLEIDYTSNERINFLFFAVDADWMSRTRHQIIHVAKEQSSILLAQISQSHFRWSESIFWFSKMSIFRIFRRIFITIDVATMLNYFHHHRTLWFNISSDFAITWKRKNKRMYSGRSYTIKPQYRVMNKVTLFFLICLSFTLCNLAITPPKILHQTYST